MLRKSGLPLKTIKASSRREEKEKSCTPKCKREIKVQDKISLKE